MLRVNALILNAVTVLNTVTALTPLGNSLILKHGSSQECRRRAAVYDRRNVGMSASSGAGVLDVSALAPSLQNLQTPEEIRGALDALLQSRFPATYQP